MYCMHSVGKNACLSDKAMLSSEEIKPVALSVVELYLAETKIQLNRKLHRRVYLKSFLGLAICLTNAAKLL